MPLSLAQPRWSLRIRVEIVRRIACNADAGRVAAMFGLHEAEHEVFYEDFPLDIAPGQIVLVTGPSGAGKSILLREAARQVPDAKWLATEELSEEDSPPVAILAGGSLARRLEILARCGLAEAPALVTSARHLSAGQLLRLALAEALHGAILAGRPQLLLADEFASSLDLSTARLLCRQVRRLVAGSPVALLAATPRPELAGDLQPDLMVVKPLGAPAAIVPGPRRRRGRSAETRLWPIVAGTIHDYDRLAAFHYLAGRPACHKRVYVIRHPARGDRWREPGGINLAAVLVVSPPLANVRGRNLATGGRYAGPDRAAALALLNAEMESISRVIVQPSFRGCGLAGRLVRHAIATGERPFMEALAAMGRVHPLFERAGMTPWQVPLEEHLERLLRVAAAAGLSESDVAAVDPVRKMLEWSDLPVAQAMCKELKRSIARQFRDRRRHHRRPTDPIAEVCRRTARRYVYYLAATPLADAGGCTKWRRG